MSSSPDSSVSYDWVDGFRSWLEEHQYSLKREQSTHSLSSLVIVLGFELAIGEKGPPRPKTLIQRRHSISSFTVRTEDHQFPSTSSTNTPAQVRAAKTEIIEHKERKAKVPVPLQNAARPRRRPIFSSERKPCKMVVDDFRTVWRWEPSGEQSSNNQPGFPKVCDCGSARRSLTRQSDILDAFQGIANHFKRLMGAGFTYGLPFAALTFRCCGRTPVILKVNLGVNLRVILRAIGRIHGARVEEKALYAHNLEHLKWRDEFLRDRLGNGYARSSEVCEDCSEFPTWS
jgi:hypothetical protein